MNTKIKTTIIIVFLVAAGISLVLVTKPAPTGGDNLLSSLSSALQTSEPSFDFGELSMARGKVNHEFSFANSSDKPIGLNQVYTSCMCTTAELFLEEGRFGPFGMPGHGFSSPIKAEMAPGEAGKVDVVFDPAAHGPAGVGPIERFVYVQTGDGSVLRFRITALVTP